MKLIIFSQTSTVVPLKFDLKTYTPHVYHEMNVCVPWTYDDRNMKRKAVTNGQKNGETKRDRHNKQTLAITEQLAAATNCLNPCPILFFATVPTFPRSSRLTFEDIFWELVGHFEWRHPSRVIRVISLVMLCGIHTRAISQQVSSLLYWMMSLKIVHSILLPQFPGAKELIWTVICDSIIAEVVW